jgi:hypothetical protein
MLVDQRAAILNNTKHPLETMVSCWEFHIIGSREGQCLILGGWDYIDITIH